MRRALRILFRTVLLGAVCIVLALGGAVGWIETRCNGEPYRQSPARYIEAPQERRPEARSFLTYPEWHIVYAYEDYARVLEGGAPQDFDYWGEVREFWKASCVMTREADRYGNPGDSTRLTLYVIGVSFTLEMAAKGLYENTLGRLASLAGANSAQDAVEAEMAMDYASFLQQTPWYLFDFASWRGRLWAAPVEKPVRGWERRLALGAEWSVKAAYAKLLARTVDATGHDATEMKIVVSRLRPEQVDGLPSGRVIRQIGPALLLEVPRYGIFTRTAQAIALAGGEFIEIAGNDDILVSVLATAPPSLAANARLLASVERREGPTRYLVAVPVEGLAGLIRTIRFGSGRLEHIYDY